MIRWLNRLFRKPKLVLVFQDVIDARSDIELIVAERWPHMLDGWHEASAGHKSPASMGRWLEAHFPDFAWGGGAIHLTGERLRNYTGAVV